MQKNELLGNSAALLMPVEWDEPFGIVIFCTSSPKIVDAKTRSKWSRVFVICSSDKACGSAPGRYAPPPPRPPIPSRPPSANAPPPPRVLRRRTSPRPSSSPTSAGCPGCPAAADGLPPADAASAARPAQWRQARPRPRPRRPPPRRHALASSLSRLTANLICRQSDQGDGGRSSSCRRHPLRSSYQTIVVAGNKRVAPTQEGIGRDRSERTGSALLPPRPAHDGSVSQLN